MAYVDQNGLVMIDEIEAAEDIKKLNAAKESLLEALAVVNDIAGINSTFKGDTANSIDLTVIELKKRIDAQTSAIDEEIRRINQVTEKYRIIDSNMKNQINSTLT